MARIPIPQSLPRPWRRPSFHGKCSKVSRIWFGECAYSAKELPGATGVQPISLPRKVARNFERQWLIKLRQTGSVQMARSVEKFWIHVLRTSTTESKGFINNTRANGGSSARGRKAGKSNSSLFVSYYVSLVFNLFRLLFQIYKGIHHFGDKFEVKRFMKFAENSSIFKGVRCKMRAWLVQHNPAGCI